MADWVEQYLAALRVRDEVEKSNLDLYEHCTKLQDHQAELAKKLTSATTQQNQDEAKIPVTAPAPSLFRVTSPPPRSDSPSLGQIRQDLAKAQQERSDLQSRLDATTRELEAFKTSSRKESKKMSQLTADVSQLTLKLRDREEELRGKAKLVEDVQDESVTLNLQLNMAEENAKKLKKENQELVDRWMARMGKEADQMNDQHKFS